MLARYIDYVNRSRTTALLWNEQLGIFHASPYAATLSGNLVESANLSAAASAAAKSRRASIHQSPFGPFLIVPLVESDERTEMVLVLGDHDLESLPSVLHDLHEIKWHFSQIVHALPQIVLTARPDGRIDYASRRWFEVTGSPNKTTDIRRSVLSAFDAEGAVTFTQQWDAGIRNRKPFAFEIPLRTARGARWHALHAEPWMHDETIRKWVVTLQDVQQAVEERTALAETRKRLRVLADVGEVLADTATIDATEQVRRVLEIASKALDVTWVASFDIDGSLRSIAYPSEAKILTRSLRAIVHVCNEIASMQRWSDEPPRPVMSARLDLGKADNYALLAIGQAGAAAFSADDITLFREIAARLTSFLRSAYAYDRERNVARVLQNAMLPTLLPQPFGIRFDVAYRPADNEALVGGDWYDAFELPDGRIALTIGDVTGHGLDAAVSMGHIREAIRVSAMQGGDPGEVLANANRTVHAGRHGATTAFVSFIDPLTLALQYASAGHVEPYIVDGEGALSALHANDVVLGVVPDAEYATHDDKLPNEGALVMYTDGLIEYGRNSVAGEAQLCQVIGDWARRGFSETASQLADRALDGARAGDDIAILITRTGSVARLETSLSSLPRNVHRARAAMLRVLARAPLTKSQRDGFVLAACEAVNNAVEHGSHSELDVVQIVVEWNDVGAYATVHSEGQWVQQESRIERGRGLVLMRALTDHMNVNVDSSGTTVQLAVRADKVAAGFRS